MFLVALAGALLPSPLPLGTEAALGATVFDVRDFGAAGDGSHDDRPAIQTALDKAGAQGGSVYVPPGTYRVTRYATSNYALRVPSGVTLYGAGDSSVIRLAAQQGAGIRVVTAKEADRVRVESLTVDGNDAQQGVWDEQNHGIFFSAVTNAVVRDVVVRNVAGDGIYFHRRSSGLIERNRLYAGPDPRIGINFQGAVDTIIRDNYMEGWSWAVKAEVDQNAPHAERIVVSGNQGVDLEDGSLALNGHSSGSYVFDVVIAGNRFQTKGSRSVWLKGARRVQIVGNVLRGGGSSVQVVADLRNADIRSNEFVDQDAGVSLNDFSDYGSNSGITVRDNLFREAGYAVSVATSTAVTGLTVTGNQLLKTEALVVRNEELARDPVVVSGNRMGDAAQPLPFTPGNVDPTGFGVDPAVDGIDDPPLETDDRRFSDVPESHPFSAAVTYLAEQGIAAGYGDGRFGVYDRISRAQLAKMTTMAFGLHTPDVESARVSFKDVPQDGEVYPFDFVSEAAAHGLVTGYSDGSFRPWEPVTRIQLVRILVRAAGEELQDPPSGWSPGFRDVSDSDRAYVIIAAYNGVAGGTSSTMFSPYAAATRGHVAAMLYRLLEG